MNRARIQPVVLLGNSSSVCIIYKLIIIESNENDHRKKMSVIESSLPRES